MTDDKASQRSKPRATTMDEYIAKQEAERAKTVRSQRARDGRASGRAVTRAQWKIAHCEEVRLYRNPRG
jgi:hypothetical protein